MSSTHHADAATSTCARSDIDTLNGDDSDFEECEDTPGFICEEEDDDEELALDENDEPIAADDELEGATVNRTNTRAGRRAASRCRRASRAISAAARTASRSALAHDESRRRVRREHRARRARRHAPRGSGRRARSAKRSRASTTSTDEHGVLPERTRSRSASDVALTVSGRYNRTHVVLEDQIDDDLNGDHTFQRFNPAVGLTWRIGAATFYAGYSEASRAPSPVELTCADEDDPCRLPNAFVADPPLEQVVAKTFEAGVRGALERRPLARGRVPHDERRRHPVHQRRRADEPGLLRQRRRDAPRRRRAQSRRRRRRAARLVRRLHVSRRDVPRGLRGREREPSRGRRRRDRGREPAIACR